MQDYHAKGKEEGIVIFGFFDSSLHTSPLGARKNWVLKNSS
jgi:hypothetical protein